MIDIETKERRLSNTLEQKCGKGPRTAYRMAKQAKEDGLLDDNTAGEVAVMLTDEEI